MRFMRSGVATVVMGAIKNPHMAGLVVGADSEWSPPHVREIPGQRRGEDECDKPNDQRGCDSVEDDIANVAVKFFDGPLGCGFWPERVAGVWTGAGRAVLLASVHAAHSCLTSSI